MRDYSIKNKTIIVTGATKGMGLASSKRLLELGAKVLNVNLKAPIFFGAVDCNAND